MPGGLAVPLAGSWRYHVGVPFDTQSGWYQGESNAQNAARDAEYRQLLPAMIGNWRAGFRQGNFPFLIVHLAGFGPGDAWLGLRQAQWLTAQRLPNCGIATAVDVGEQWNIHPGNQQEVGRRLALVAEAKVYGEPVDYAGPVYQAVGVAGSSAYLSFGHLGGGLVAKDGPLTGFQLAGADGKFVPAEAKIDGDTVVVSAESVPAPAEVRYAWEAYPECSLYSKAGLPAFPFDTSAR